MAKYRDKLPQLSQKIFVTDGGMETTLIFHQGVDLPAFAAFDLLTRAGGPDMLADYYRRYLSLAQQYRCGFILESVTWRANADWGATIGYDRDRLVRINHDAIAMLQDLRAEFETEHTPVVISGCVGPRGDGYKPGVMMTAEQARDYHSEQIATLRDTEADMVSAITMTTIEEGLGVALAAQDAQMPAVISFTLETDGRLPSGQSLQQAIETVDAQTTRKPAYYMINCAHPDHFAGVLQGSWLHRIRGLRANASRCSHAELDEATELDAGNPHELGQQYRELLKVLPGLNVLGGCCGTDHRHVAAICASCI
jgi:S-methylmethionine-dependent homocysteine/selenocysteine methylase